MLTGVEKETLFALYQAISAERHMHMLVVVLVIV